MNKASRILLLLVGILTLVGSLVSSGVAYGSTGDRPGTATLAEISAWKPEVASAVRARRATAAAYGAGFATLFLAITLGPYRRGDVWAWWALLAGMLTVSLLVLLRIPFLGVRLGSTAAVSGAGSAVSALVQLGVVGLALALGAGRLGGGNAPA